MLKWIRYILPFYTATIDSDRDFNEMRRISGFFVNKLDSLPWNKTWLKDIQILNEFNRIHRPKIISTFTDLINVNKHIGPNENDTYSNHFFRTLEKLMKCFKKKAEITDETMAPITVKVKSLNEHKNDDQENRDLMMTKFKIDASIALINEQIFKVISIFWVSNVENRLNDSFNGLVSMSNKFRDRWASFAMIIQRFTDNFSKEIALNKEIANEIDGIFDEILKKNINGGYLVGMFSG